MFNHFCCLFAKTLLNQRSGGGSPYSGLYGKAPPPERGAFSKLAVYERVGKIASCCSSSCKVEEMVVKAKYIKAVPHFSGRNDFSTESERLKTREKRGDYRKFYCFGSSLRYKKGVQFCSRYMKGVSFWQY